MGVGKRGSGERGALVLLEAFSALGDRHDERAHIDLAAQCPTKLLPEMQLHADWAVTLACGATCPCVPTVVEAWDIPDAAGKTLDEIRLIRDQIELRLFDLSQPTVSHHLKVLRDAAIVESEKQGLWAYYYVEPGALDELAGWLS